MLAVLTPTCSATSETDKPRLITYRLRVPGGWLYRHQSTHIDAVPCMTFVPDPLHGAAVLG
jgi:hypothetical protein